MHSKSDNLGYLKDKKRDIFRGLHPLDPHQGSALDPLQGGLRACPQTRSPMMLASLASFAITYLFFSGLTLRMCSEWKAQIQKN